MGRGALVARSHLSDFDPTIVLRVDPVAGLKSKWLGETERKRLQPA